MAKVLLCYPLPSVSSPQRSPPLSILHVGESIKRFGHEVRYYDARWDPDPDLDWPDIIGCSSMTGHQLKGAIHWLKRAKEHGKKTVLGGIHATMLPEECIVEDYVDVVVCSEGELSMLEAIDAVPKTIVQRHMLQTKDMVSPVSPDTLRYFAYSDYTGDTILLTSRGCPWRCSFCFNQKFFERTWQPVNLERWKEDILYLKRAVGLRKLEHADDWIGKLPRALEIIKFLSDNGIECRPSLRAHQIDDEAARQLAGLGVKHISVGMETGSERMLLLTQKDIQKWHQVRCAEALAQHGIWPLLYWIVGFPTETREEVDETLDQADLMAKIFRQHGTGLTQNFYSFVALPGSPLYDLVDKSKLPHTMEGWSDYSLNQTHDVRASNLYHIGGIWFHRGKGDKTDRNFPGLSRLLIVPFELLAGLRWKLRYFDHYWERHPLEALLRWASRRGEIRAKTLVAQRAEKMDVIDWGVRSGTEGDTVWRGEWQTGEIGKE